MAAAPEFEFTELFPLGHDDTPYRLVSTDHVRTVDTPLGTMLQVDPEALTLITQEAMRDIAHFLRPGHLQQLRNILDDPEASDNDRFVALDLLKNAAISAGGVLPMCQDTGTAIVKAKKGQMRGRTPAAATRKPSPAACSTRTRPATCATARWRR